MRHAAKVGVLLLVPLFVLAGCDNGDTPTTPTPAPTTTDTFAGTLTLNGAGTHSFVATAAGTVTATITGVEPTTSPSFGFSMGTWDGTNCTAIVSNQLATTSAVLTGTVIGATSLCVRLFDSQGTIPSEAPIGYTVQVVHP